MTDSAALPVILAHGAAGTSASMRPHVDGLHRRGLEALAIDLPKRKAEAAVGAYAAAVADLPASVVGGHSYGGRVASLLAAEQTPRGLVLLSYPLHRPGQPEWRPRTAHWPEIGCPVLLLSGEADPFATIDLLREAAGLLPQAQLVTYPRLRHGLQPVLDDVLAKVASFVDDLGV